MNILKKFINIINTPNDDGYRINVDEQIVFLAKFPDPVDNIERSYFQYLCQCKLYGKAFVYRNNLLAFFIYWVIMLFSCKVHEPSGSSNNNYAIFNGSKNSLKCIPPSLEESYDEIGQFSKLVPKMTRNDRNFLREIHKRYRRDYYFLLKIAIKIMLYRTQITKFSPRAIITTSEYSFTSSVLTEFCNRNQVLHINVMHGNKAFYIRDSFFKFDYCYVWDEYFESLFCKLKADSNQFVIEKPYSQYAWPCSNVNKEVDFTYYLQNENISTLKKISEVLHNLSLQGNKIAIRPHPIYSNIHDIQRLFYDFDIEDNNLIEIEKSVLRTRHAISLSSTVLIQAYNNGIPVVIDDVSNPEHYKELKNRTFICLEKDHTNLSAFLHN